MSIAVAYRHAFFDEYKFKCHTENGAVAYQMAKRAASLAAARHAKVAATDIVKITDAARIDLDRAGVERARHTSMLARHEIPIAYFSRGTVGRLVVRVLGRPDIRHVISNVSAFETLEWVLCRTGMFFERPDGISVEPLPQPDDSDDETYEPQTVYIATGEMRVGHCVHAAVHRLAHTSDTTSDLLAWPTGDEQSLSELTIFVGSYKKRSSPGASPADKKSRPSDE